MKTSPKVSRTDTKPSLENQTMNTLVQCLTDSEKLQLGTQRKKSDLTANDSGGDNIFPLKLTTSEILEGIVRDEITKEL